DGEAQAGGVAGQMAVRAGPAGAAVRGGHPRKPLHGRGRLAEGAGVEVGGLGDRQGEGTAPRADEDPAAEVRGDHVRGWPGGPALGGLPRRRPRRGERPHGGAADSLQRRGGCATVARISCCRERGGGGGAAAGADVWLPGAGARTAATGAAVPATSWRATSCD